MKNPPPPILSPQWTDSTKRIIALILFIGGAILFWLLRDLVVLLLVAVVLAYLLHPLMKFFEDRVLWFMTERLRWVRHGLAVFMTFLVVIFVIVIVFLVIVPLLLSQLEEFGSSLPGFIETIAIELEQFLREPLTFNGEPVLIDGEEFVPMAQITAATGATGLVEMINLENFNLVEITQTFLGSVGTVTGPAFTVLGSALNTLIMISFLVMMLFYFLRDGAKFVNDIVGMMPKSYQSDVRRLFLELSYVWDAYLRGQLILCVTIGVAVYIAAVLLGLPNAPVLGLIAGILEFIPNVGPTLALIPAGFLALVSESATIVGLQGVPFLILVVICWTGIQILESMFVVPRVMGTSLDLHPLLVIIAVIGGATIAGAMGVLLAAPLLASSRVIWLYFYGKLTDQDMLPKRELNEKQPLFVMPRWAVRFRDWARPYTQRLQERFQSIRVQRNVELQYDDVEN